MATVTSWRKVLNINKIKYGHRLFVSINQCGGRDVMTFPYLGDPATAFMFWHRNNHNKSITHQKLFILFPWKMLLFYRFPELPIFPFSLYEAEMNCDPKLE